MPEEVTQDAVLDYVEQLEGEVEALHTFCEARGYNSRGTADVLGRPFDVPVDRGALNIPQRGAARYDSLLSA